MMAGLNNASIFDQQDTLRNFKMRSVPQVLFAELERLELIVKDKDKYKGNIEIMRGYMPMRKTKVQLA